MSFATEVKKEILTITDNKKEQIAFTFGVLLGSSSIILSSNGVKLQIKSPILNVIKKINAIDTEFATYSTLASIRNSINTSDEKYEKAQEFFDEVSPQYQDLSTTYYRVLISLTF